MQKHKKKTEKKKHSTRLKRNEAKYKIEESTLENTIETVIEEVASEEQVGLPKKKWKWKNIAIIVGVSIFLLGVLYYFFVFPNIRLSGNRIVRIPFGSSYTEEGATLVQFGKNINTDQLKTTGSVDTSHVGTYYITYQYRGLLFERKVIREVIIYDDEKPVITLIGEVDQTICPGTDYQEEGYQAQDNYDGDLTDKVVVEKSDNAYIYRVTDSNGNTAVVERRIKKEDITPPVITLKGNTIIYLTLGSTYQEPGYTAIDGCEGDLTSKVQVKGNVNVNQIGSYELTYEVSDSAGNIGSAVRKVIISERTTSGKKGVIYLTFDDGPHATNTKKILDVLKEEGVKATFFVTMSGPDYLIQREYQEGHTVGLHTATHQYSVVYSSVNSYFNDLTTVHDRVKRLTGYDSRIIRFPGGSSNTISAKYSKGIMTKLTNEVLARGFRYYDWNVSGEDTGSAKTSQAVYQNVIKGLRKDRANIVLLHDIKSYTADAVRDIIRYGKNNGYSFEKITVDTAMVHQRVNN